jgi:hypothetical protein
LLRRYVRTAISAEKIHDKLDLTPVGSAEAAALLRQVIASNASLGGLAAKMRLSTQVTVTPRSTGRLAETGHGALDDSLIGVRLRH